MLMRHFTRQRHDRLQDVTGIPETSTERDRRLARATHEWEQANSAYLDYIAGVRRALPAEVQRLVGMGLHDAVCTSVGMKRGRS
jgi:hypothetical protein